MNPKRRDRSISRSQYLLFCLGICLILGACSKEVGYRPGLVTQHVQGQIELAAGNSDSQAFVVVRKHNVTLIETSAGYLRRIAVNVLHPDEKGRYSASFDAETRQLDLTFISRGRRPVSHSFRRTLGIGAYRYDVCLKPDPQWRESYYLLIKPTLVDFIVEKRYQLAPAEQLFLGDWMVSAEKQLK